VPITAAVCVIVAEVSATARAMPKSITFTSPFGVSITLAGLMSRWMMPARWLYSKASRTSAAISSARSGRIRRPSRSTSRRVRPSTYSITMYGTETPSTISSPVS
jgi:hypothetical protein